MTNPITLDDFDNLPAGTCVRDTYAGLCEEHGVETDYSDYRKLEDGTWEVYHVSETLEMLFRFMSAVGIEPSTVEDFREAEQQDAEKGGTHTYVVLEPAEVASGEEVAA